MSPEFVAPTPFDVDKAVLFKQLDKPVSALDVVMVHLISPAERLRTEVLSALRADAVLD